MSKFSEYLTKLIENSGETVKQIADNSGVERTSIQKAKTDERDLSYKSVRALANYLNLTMDQRKELFLYHEMKLLDDDIFEKRQATAELLNDLASVHFFRTTPPNVEHLEFSHKLIKGEYAIKNAIRTVLNYEATHTVGAHFSMFLPEKLDLTQEFIELWMSDIEFTADSLVCFHTDKNGDFKNLKLLRSVIPLCLASCGNFHPYYFCEAPKTATMSPLSYYIITPNYLIQISEDISTAQIHDDKELISFYNCFFKKLIDCCDLLVNCNANILETLQEYIANTSPDCMRVLMPQPCPGRYITTDVIRKYMNNLDMPYNEMFALVDKHFSVLRHITGTYQTAFSEEGLINLINTCSLADLPPQYVPPLDPKDIKGMLIKLYKEIESGTVQGVIIRPTALQIPEYLSIYAHPTDGLHIYTTNAFIYGAYCCNIHITEKSICHLFNDFMESLGGKYNNMAYSKEDTLKLLKQHISEMDTANRT